MVDSVYFVSLDIEFYVNVKSIYILIKKIKGSFRLCIHIYTCEILLIKHGN